MNHATRDPYAGDADELRERLRALTEEVQRNELLLRKTQAREVELLLAPTLGELFHRIVSGLRDAYGLDAVTLSLYDPQHEKDACGVGSHDACEDYVLFDGQLTTAVTPDHALSPPEAAPLPVEPDLALRRASARLAHLPATVHPRALSVTILRC